MWAVEHAFLCCAGVGACKLRRMCLEMMRAHIIIAMVTWQTTKPRSRLPCLQPHHILLSFSGNYQTFSVPNTSVWVCMCASLYNFPSISLFFCLPIFLSDHKEKWEWGTKRRFDWKPELELSLCGNILSISLISFLLHHTQKPQGDKVLGRGQRDKPLYGEQITVRQDRACYITGTWSRLCFRLCRRAHVCLLRQSRDSVCSHRYNRLFDRRTYLVGTSLQGMA